MGSMPMDAKKGDMNKNKNKGDKMGMGKKPADMGDDMPDESMTKYPDDMDGGMMDKSDGMMDGDKPYLRKTGMGSMPMDAKKGDMNKNKKKGDKMGMGKKPADMGDDMPDNKMKGDDMKGDMKNNKMKGDDMMDEYDGDNEGYY